MFQQKSTLIFGLILALVLIVANFIGEINQGSSEEEISLEQSAQTKKESANQNIFGETHSLFPEIFKSADQNASFPKADSSTEGKNITDQEEIFLEEDQADSNLENADNNYFIYLKENPNKSNYFSEEEIDCDIEEAVPGSNFCEEVCADREAKIKDSNNQAYFQITPSIFAFTQTLMLAFDPCAHCGPCTCLCHCCGPYCCH